MKQMYGDSMEFDATNCSKFGSKKIKRNKKDPIQKTQLKEKNAMDVAKKIISKEIVVLITIKFLKTILLQLLKNIILM